MGLNNISVSSPTSKDKPTRVIQEETKQRNSATIVQRCRDKIKSTKDSDCNPVATPLPLKLDNLKSDVFSEPTYFRSLAGKLQYLTITRPDIQYAVNFICQRMHSPTISDFGLLKRVLRYIKGTCQLGLNIQRNTELKLSAYNDSDWAGCQETRRSTTGFCTFLGSNIISWSAKRQQTVSKSSTEAEYRALSAVAQELTWISSLLRDLQIPQEGPTTAQCDNLSYVYLNTNPALHSRSKHFDTDYHYMREQVSLGLIETKHISNTHQIADIFTKSLPRRPFYELRSKLGVSDSPTTSLRGNIANTRTMGLDNISVSSPNSKDKPTRVIQEETRQWNPATIVQRCRDKIKSTKDPLLFNKFDALTAVLDD